MYTYTWFAHSVFDEDEDLILVQDTKFFDNRDNCIQAALLDKPLSPLSYSTILQVDHIVPQYKKYIDYTERLGTYRQWPRYSLPRPETLTKAGLFYSQIGDIVTCFHCGTTLSDWQPFDDPLTRHATESKYCDFVITNASARQRNLDTK